MRDYEYNRRDKPKCCKDCENYQPRWRYRSCSFCPLPIQTEGYDFPQNPSEKRAFSAERGGEDA